MAMTIPEHISRGKACFQASEFEEAVVHFTRAIELAPANSILYDCRSAAYERLGAFKLAVADAKMTIELAPGKWQGYSRSARLFFVAHKYDSCLSMLTLALERIKERNTTRRVELENLRSQALQAKEILLEAQRRRSLGDTDQLGALPVELIVNIFNEVVSSHPAQVVGLSHVSQKWRTIAVNTPLLWRTLMLPSATGVTRKLKTWIERSGNRIETLHVRSRVENELLHACQGQPPALFQTLRALTLEGCERFLKTYYTRLIYLEELHVNGLDSAIYPLHQIGEVSVFLRTLKIFRAPIDLSILARSFSKLVSLELRDITISGEGNLLQVLAANSSLEHVAVRLGTSRSAFSAFPKADFGQRFPLPKLSVLDLDFLLAPYDILRWVEVPNLKTLLLFRSPLSLHSLFHHLLQQGVDLTELRISGCSVSVESVVQYLRSSMSLRTLAITNASDLSNAVIEALASPPSPSTQDTSDTRAITSVVPLCPLLQHLDFSHCPDVKAGALVRLVKSRLSQRGEADDHSSALILSLVVDGCPSIDAEVVPWLRSKVPSFSCVYMNKHEARLAGRRR